MCTLWALADSLDEVAVLCALCRPWLTALMWSPCCVHSVGNVKDSILIIRVRTWRKQRLARNKESEERKKSDFKVLKSNDHGSLSKVQGLNRPQPAQTMKTLPKLARPPCSL